MGMDMSSSSSMNMTTNSTASTSMSMETMVMMVAFQNTMTSTLYVESWTPNSIGTYAASCIFLIGLAAILRGLFAVKAVMETRWLDQELKRRYIVVNGRQSMQEQLSEDNLKQNMMLSANGVEEQVMVVQKRSHHYARPWRISVDPARAVIDTIIAAVGYLL